MHVHASDHYEKTLRCNRNGLASQGVSRHKRHQVCRVCPMSWEGLNGAHPSYGSSRKNTNLSLKMMEGWC